jgi:hypothetical protein
MTPARHGLTAALVLFSVGFAPAQPPGFAPAPPATTFTYDIPKAVTSPPPAVVSDAAGGLLPTPPPKIWFGGGEIGLNGATGNTELFNLRTGFNAKRKTADNLLVTDFLYTYARQNGLLTQNQMLFNARDEILFPNTPWSLFAATNVEYDELRAFRIRAGVYGGVGYQVIDTPTTNWRLRAGAGAVREIAGYAGGPASRWTPEMVFGTDFSHKFDDRQSFEATLDYYPRIDQWGQFRLRARAFYQVLLDKENGITLRLGVQDRYDSNPGFGDRNDLNYFATLGFTF